MSQNILKPVKTLLLANAAIVALLESDVFYFEFPKIKFKNMPKYAALIRRVPGNSGSQSGYMETEGQDLEVFAFGATPSQADVLHRLIYTVLKQTRRGVVDEVLIHGFNPTGSPQSERDPDNKWPFVRSLWSLLASETAAS